MPFPSARSSPSSLLAFPGVRFPTRTCCADRVPVLACPRTSLLRMSSSKPGDAAHVPSRCLLQGLQPVLGSCSAAGMSCTRPSASASAHQGLQRGFIFGTQRCQKKTGLQRRAMSPHKARRLAAGSEFG